MPVVWPALDGIRTVLAVQAESSQFCSTAAPSPRCEAATCTGGALQYLVVRCCEPVQPLCCNRVSRLRWLVPSQDLVSPPVRVVTRTVDEAELAVSCSAHITPRQCAVTAPVMPGMSKLSCLPSVNCSSRPCYDGFLSAPQGLAVGAASLSSQTRSLRLPPVFRRVVSPVRRVAPRFKVVCFN